MHFTNVSNQQVVHFKLGGGERPPACFVEANPDKVGGAVGKDKIGNKRLY